MDSTWQTLDNIHSIQNLRRAHLQLVGLMQIMAKHVKSKGLRHLWMRVKGPHNYMVTTLGSCVKQSLLPCVGYCSEGKLTMGNGKTLHDASLYNLLTKLFMWSKESTQERVDLLVIKHTCMNAAIAPCIHFGLMLHEQIHITLYLDISEK